MHKCEGITGSMVEEGRGARLRAGQYAQTGSGSGGINEMGRKILWTARKGGVGGRCEYRRWSNAFTMRLAFSRTLG